MCVLQQMATLCFSFVHREKRNNAVTTIFEGLQIFVNAFHLMTNPLGQGPFQSPYMTSQQKKIH